MHTEQTKTTKAPTQENEPIDTSERVFRSECIVKGVTDEVWNASLPEVELPAGYGVIGGAARSIAFQIIKGGSPLYVRDVDLVATQDANEDVAFDLAEKYNPDDNNHGHGVQEIRDINEYFDSRDFTINQLMVIDGNLYMTKEACRDIAEGVIRLTPYEHRDDWIPSDRMILKALLLESALSSEGGDVRISAEDQAAFRDRSVNDAFCLALMLQKSLEYGNGVAGEYWKKLAGAGLLNEFGDGMKGAAMTGDWTELAGEINSNIYGFEYRGKALDATTNQRLLSEFMWSQDDSAFEYDPVEHQRDKLEDYSGKGREYLDSRYGAW